MSKKQEDRTTKEIIADLREELHTIYERARGGISQKGDEARADQIAHTIHELQGDDREVTT
jgi:DNA-binding ferritin-like protein